MSIYEKKSGPLLSYSAIIISVVATAALLFAAEKNPRKYAASMAVNHHASYGSSLDCSACHVSEGVFSVSSKMTCFTSGCHGELKQGGSLEDALAALEPSIGFMPDFEERVEHYYFMHREVQEMNCYDCHTEHTMDEVPFPDGWEAYNPEAHSVSLTGIDDESYISIFDQSNNS